MSTRTRTPRERGRQKAWAVASAAVLLSVGVAIDGLGPNVAKAAPDVDMSVDMFVGSAVITAADTPDPDTSSSVLAVGSVSLTVIMRVVRSTIPIDVSISDAAGAVVAEALLADGESLNVSDLAPGGYTITESLRPDIGPSVRVRGIECSNGQSSESNSINVNAAEGSDVTCTITNDPQTSRDLEVGMLVVWNGSQPDREKSFEVCLQGPSYPSGDEVGACRIFVLEEVSGSSGPRFEGWEAWSQLERGDYTIAETDPGDDWEVTARHVNPVAIPGPAEVPGEPVHTRFSNTYSPSITTIDPPATATTLPSSGSASPSTGDAPELPSTGSSSSRPVMVIASLLVVLGVALAFARRTA